MKRLFLVTIFAFTNSNIWSQELSNNGFNLSKDASNSLKILDPIYIAGFEESVLENLKTTIQMDEVDELAIKNVLHLFKQQKESKSVTADELKSLLDQKIKGIIGDEQFEVWKASQLKTKGMQLLIK